MIVGLSENKRGGFNLLCRSMLAQDGSQHFLTLSDATENGAATDFHFFVKYSLRGHDNRNVFKVQVLVDVSPLCKTEVTFIL